MKQLLPEASRRRFKSSGENFALGLDAMLSRLNVEPLSDSTVMVIPHVPEVDAASAAVGQTHLARQRIYTSVTAQKQSRGR